MDMLYENGNSITSTNGANGNDMFMTGNYKNGDIISNGHHETYKPLIRNKMNGQTNHNNERSGDLKIKLIIDTKKSTATIQTSSNEKTKSDVSTKSKQSKHEADEEQEKVFCICRKKMDDQNDDDMMIECDVCKDWLHGKCVNINNRISIDIETYVCPRCVTEERKTIFKKRTNYHRHDYSDPHAAKKPMQAGTKVFVEKLLERKFLDALENGIVQKLDTGDGLTLELLEKNGFKHPILVENKEGLNFKIPESNEMSLTKIQDIVGSDIMLDVIDVERQETVPMTINELNDYFKTDEKLREKIYNLISFEISKTKLNDNITAPDLVHQISWVSNGVWPPGLNDSTLNNTNDLIIKPEVQKYCLISASTSYTDFHIDFGGSSVWYHVVKGDKIFYLIEPTSENLSAYETWNASKNHSEIFLGDKVDKCYSFYIKAGNTIFLPTGWIHAVYTPNDSLVFGGNFLQSFNIPLQLKCYEMELRLKTPEKYRFPAFEALQWYAAKFYTQKIKEQNSSRETVDQKLLASLKYLLNVLKKWMNSKDFYQLHEHEIPKTINCDKLTKIMTKEFNKAEILLKLANKSDKPRLSTSNSQNESFEHMESKEESGISTNVSSANTFNSKMFIDGSNDQFTDDEKTAGTSSGNQKKQKKPKEVLNYGNMNLLEEIKLDNEQMVEAINLDESLTFASDESKKQDNETKKEPLIMKIPKIVTMAASDCSTDTTGTLKLKLKIKNPQETTGDEKISKKSKKSKEKSLDELIKNDEKSVRKDEDDEILKELKSSYADNDYVYPSLSEKSKKRRQAKEEEEEDMTGTMNESGKSVRKRKLKPHAMQYLQPPKQSKQEEGELKEELEEGESESKKKSKKPKKLIDKLIEKNLKAELETVEPVDNKNKLSKADKDDEDYKQDDDDYDPDDEDFKLKCKNNLKLSKKIKKNQIKQQQQDQTSPTRQPTSSKKASMQSQPATSSSNANKKFKKGFVTTKQRLSKLLKLNRIVNI